MNKARKEKGDDGDSCGSKCRCVDVRANERVSERVSERVKKRVYKSYTLLDS